jgi:hypothetical protein
MAMGNSLGDVEWMCSIEPADRSTGVRSRREKKEHHTVNMHLPFFSGSEIRGCPMGGSVSEGEHGHLGPPWRIQA